MRRLQRLREIDEGRFVDLIEVDAASRTKVDDTRELLDNVQYSPTRGRYKVYLIDEVHMLSTHSFNALLKTLEEPPPHVKFLLATTDPQKLPVTVLSRCLQFNLKRLPAALIYGALTQIAAAEKLDFEPRRVAPRGAAADGSMRDALSLLDQVIAFGGGKLTEADTRAMLGTLDRTARVRDRRGAARATPGMCWLVDALDESRRTTRRCSTIWPRCCRSSRCCSRAGPAARRRRGRDVRACSRAALQSRKTCSCSTRSRSSVGATSISRRIRAADSR